MGSCRSERPSRSDDRRLGLPLASPCWPSVSPRGARAGAAHRALVGVSPLPARQPARGAGGRARKPVSAQEPETPPAPEPEAPVPGGQERSGEGSTEAIGPTADGPETLPWMLIAALTWAAIMLLLAALPSHSLGLLHMPFLVDKRFELGLWGLAVGVSVVVGSLVTMVP